MYFFPVFFMLHCPTVPQTEDTRAVDGYFSRGYRLLQDREHRMLLNPTQENACTHIQQPKDQNRSHKIYCTQYFSAFSTNFTLFVPFWVSRPSSKFLPSCVQFPCTKMLPLGFHIMPIIIFHCFLVLLLCLSQPGSSGILTLISVDIFTTVPAKVLALFQESTRTAN